VCNPTGEAHTIYTDNLDFTRTCPLDYEKLRAIIDGIEIDPYGGYFLSEKMKIDTNV
jgi:hypothetical protein